MSRKQREQQALNLWRTPGQSVRWVVRSATFRTLLVLILCAALTLVTIWQWPVVTWAYERVTASFQPDEPRYEPVDFTVTPDTETTSQADDLRDKLTLSVGAAGALISSKAAEGVTADKIKPAQDALAAAQELLDKGIRLIPLLTARLDALTSATTTLSAQTPPPPPVVVQPPADNGSTDGGRGDSGDQGGSNGGSNGGTNNGGGGGGGTATTSSSLTCNGGTVRVTFTATGGGTVSVSVSGPASGSNSGSGSATVVVTGPGGSYSASASASGTVAISGHCG